MSMNILAYVDFRVNVLVQLLLDQIAKLSIGYCTNPGIFAILETWGMFALGDHCVIPKFSKIVDLGNNLLLRSLPIVAALW